MALETDPPVVDVADPKAGFRWPVAIGAPIAAPAEELWDVISMPGNLELCHPFCARNPVDVWPGEGSRDEIHYLNGWVFERQFRSWIEGVGYDLEIGERGGRKSFVSWRIVPSSSDAATLRITVYPHLLQQLPVMIRRFPYRWWIRPMLTKYLSSVVRGFEWYVIRGEPVPRNQFGTHPWFSSRVRDGSATY